MVVSIVICQSSLGFPSYPILHRRERDLITAPKMHVLELSSKEKMVICALTQRIDRISIDHARCNLSLSIEIPRRTRPSATKPSVFAPLLGARAICPDGHPNFWHRLGFAPSSSGADFYGATFSSSRFGAATAHCRVRLNTDACAPAVRFDCSAPGP